MTNSNLPTATGAPQSMAGAVNSLVELSGNKDLIALVGNVIESRKMELEFRHRIEKITSDYAALRKSHKRIERDRDRTRELIRIAIQLLGECGLQSEIPGVIKNFLDHTPQYSRDVVDLITSRR